MEQVKYLEKTTVARVILPGLPTPGSINTSQFKNASISKRSLVASYGYNWGDVRISHRTRAAFAASTSYIYDNTAGVGSWIYIVDTGVLLNHQVSRNGGNIISLPRPIAED
jgi:hypothetical protein